MKRTLFLSILIVFFTTSFLSIVGCNNQKSTKELYQLQEQCGKSSEEYYKKNYGGEGWYTSHYNKKLNKCFISYRNLSSGFGLIDIQEHKPIGGCLTNGSCYMLGKGDIKIDEWYKLVKPYMEE
jgi:hypothetical protein